MKDSRRIYPPAEGIQNPQLKICGVFHHCPGNGVDGVHTFDEHVLPCVEFANGLSGARSADLLDAGSNRAGDIE